MNWLHVDMGLFAGIILSVLWMICAFGDRDLEGVSFGQRFTSATLCATLVVALLGRLSYVLVEWLI